MTKQLEYQAITLVRYDNNKAHGGRSNVTRRRGFLEVAVPQPHGGTEWYNGFKRDHTGYFRLMECSGVQEIVLRCLSPRVYKGFGYVAGDRCRVSIYLFKSLSID